MTKSARNLLVLASLITVACSSVVNDICESQFSCEGWNDTDLEACIASSEGARDSADAYGCKDKYDALLECKSSDMRCTTEEGEKPKWVSEAKCTSESETYLKCIGAASSRFD